jgi:L-glyceraldehyde 3-phosphate reductase
LERPALSISPNIPCLNVPPKGLLGVLQDRAWGVSPSLPGGRSTDQPLSERYSGGFTCGQRQRFLNPDQITEEKLAKVRRLNELAEHRGQKLSQMALAWILRHDTVTSVLIGASKTAQIDDAVGMLENRHFSEEELAAIETILTCTE